ncbi:hypothetical protein [Kutzneria sp. CA-103260]|uniref:hypothetical protein n=1 Tax=Kutzneria sp. CA-103260 TaxID=2802641 RepID=UPI001BA8A8F1|nr:hypothetical protein [Kutzneria sp. CA-103260]QUQ66060.1 hypothetical protein JJ691_37850 [Kutzneria sp. CA-103260]
MAGQNPSLVLQLRELRRSYTGETDSSLLPAVAAGLRTLPVGSREKTSKIMNSGFEARLLGENCDPPVTGRIRRAVLADAADSGQQQLEAGILYALGGIAPYQWPETKVVAPMPVCVAVRPAVEGGSITMHMRASAATPMITTLLPRVVDGTVRGLAGLRVRIHRRHVELYLADATGSGSVHLANMSVRQWAGMLGYARMLTGYRWPTYFDEPLTDPERAAITRGRVPGPGRLASALLRRLRIFGDTVWFTAQPSGLTDIHLTWAGGHTAPHVAVALVHPVAGLPGDRFIVTPAADGTITITSVEPSGASAARIVLCQSPLTAQPSFAPIDTRAAWAEFDRVMKLPAQELSKVVNGIGHD